MDSKVVLLEELVQIRRHLGRENKRVVFTNGCFDILHRGHVEYLSTARAYGDTLIIGLNSDASTRRLKGNDRPINPELDRAIVLSALESVSYVTIFEEDTPASLIGALEPDVLIKGGDYRIEDIVGREVVEARGGTVLTVPFLENRSTTSIINKLEQSEEQGVLDE